MQSIIEGKFDHLTNITDRLNLIEYLITNNNIDIKIN
jgi:hypothetical protein